MGRGVGGGGSFLFPATEGGCYLRMQMLYVGTNTTEETIRTKSSYTLINFQLCGLELDYVRLLVSIWKRLRDR